MRNLKSRRAYAALFAAALIIATSCSDPEARTGGSSAAVSPADAAVKGSMEEVCKAGQQEGEQRKLCGRAQRPSLLPSERSRHLQIRPSVGGVPRHIREPEGRRRPFRVPAGAP